MVAFTSEGGILIGNGELFVIHELRHQGLSISAIARHTGLNRKTVRKYLEQGQQVQKPGFDGAKFLSASRQCRRQRTQDLTLVARIGADTAAVPQRFNQAVSEPRSRVAVAFVQIVRMIRLCAATLRMHREQKRDRVVRARPGEAGDGGRKGLEVKVPDRRDRPCHLSLNVAMDDRAIFPHGSAHDSLQVSQREICRDVPYLLDAPGLQFAPSPVVEPRQLVHAVIGVHEIPRAIRMVGALVRYKAMIPGLDSRRIPLREHGQHGRNVRADTVEQRVRFFRHRMQREQRIEVMLRTFIYVVPVEREHARLADIQSRAAQHPQLHGRVQYEQVLEPGRGLDFHEPPAAARQPFEHVRADQDARLRYHNGAPLNDANFELEVNFLEYWELKPNGKQQHFSWVTDLPIGASNLMDLMRAGRARWRIENETFNTLKNQGYGFGHNYGHGEKHLVTVFAFLMMLAFLIDQVQQRCCAWFQAARAKEGRALYFWNTLRGLFLNFVLPDWETLYRAIAFGHRSPLVLYDTS